MTVIGGLKGERTITPSPLTQPISKRDKRRSILAEKLNELTMAFSQNRDSHCRQQLQALQADMNLIMRADPYQNQPLDDFGDDIADLITAVVGSNSNPTVNSAGAGGPGGQRKADIETSATSGRWYAKYVEEINNAMEERDASLTVLQDTHERAFHKFSADGQYKIRFAEEEHRILAGTLRERLIQNIGHKKARLMREKEQLDIADSNALLLHPSQFSITNPASPGGAHSNRKTRNTRQRPGDVDDLGGAYSVGDGGARKRRKPGPEEQDTDSPGPKPRITDIGNGSPHRGDGRARLVAAQMNAPLYSVERLFTEKELAFSLNAAAVATTQYFANLKARVYGMGVRETQTDALNSGEEEDGPGSGGGASAPEGEGVEENSIMAPEMDRGANPSHHATRSTRNALSVLGDVAISQKITTYGPAVPLILSSSSSLNKAGTAPIVPVLTMDESEEDLKRFERLARAGSTATTDQKLLEQICAPLENIADQYGGGGGNGNNTSGLLLRDDLLLPSVTLATVTASSSSLPATTTTTTAMVTTIAGNGAGGGSGGDGGGGIMMSTQSSMAGGSDVTGVPMSRG